MPEPRKPSAFIRLIESQFNQDDVNRRLEAYSHFERDVLPEAFEELRALVAALRLSEEELHLYYAARGQSFETAELHKRRYQELFELAPSAVAITDRNGAIREINAAARRLLGLRTERGIGTLLSTFVRPRKKGLFRACLNAVRQSERTQVFSIDLVTPDVSIIAAVVSVSPVDFGGSYALHWTITDDNAAQIFVDRAQQVKDVLRASNEIIQVLDRMSDAFFALDREMRVVYVNAQAQSLCKLSTGGLIGRSFESVAPIGLIGEPMEKILLAARQQRVVEFETFVPDIGSWIIVRAYPLGDGVTVYCHGVKYR